MVGYWVGKLIFDMKDADRISSSSSSDIIEWHMDCCRYGNIVKYIVLMMLGYIHGFYVFIYHGVIIQEYNLTKINF